MASTVTGAPCERATAPRTSRAIRDPLRGLPAGRVGERPGDLLAHPAAHLLDAADAVDGGDPGAARPVVVEHRGGLPLVLVHALADHLCGVVAAPLLAGAAEQALDQVVDGDGEREDEADLAAPALEHPVERPRLSDRAREAA